MVGIGEVLFDCFDDRKVLGGAPVNFAFHANQLLRVTGGRGVPVSRVGTDYLGQQLLAELTARGLATDYIQSDPQLATGSVVVTVDSQGQPEYEISQNAAWDALESTPDFLQLAKRCDAVCFGTLAQRSPQSRAAIQEFLAIAENALRVFDLNLRQAFYDVQIIVDGLQRANVVKLNEEELDEVWRLLDFKTAEDQAVDAKVFYLCQQYQLQALALTRGSQGTLLFAENERFVGAPGNYAPVENADSVGAGDACCAAMVVGLLHKRPMEQVLSLANEVGAYVASQSGATPELPEATLERA
ncbi:MAG: carbohydrate kinase [Lacipirellulaceae bacterium]